MHAAADAPLLLITIPLSHYCEKARWALDRLGVPYREEGHIPFASRLAGARHGVWSSVPLLITPGGPVPDSTAILHWLDERAPAGKRLYPDGSEAALRREVEELEEELDKDVGVHARRMVYDQLLPETEMARGLLTQHVGAVEKRVAGVLFPVMRKLMVRGLRIDAAGVARSIEKVDRAFERLDARLADGRRYLCGDRLTAADITLGALAAPLVQPREYFVELPPVEELPARARESITRYRATRTGEYVLRLYREERGRAR